MLEIELMHESTIASPIEEQQGIINVSFVNRGTQQRLIFAKGRYRIGSSELCHVQIGSRGSEVSAILDVTEERVLLQCTAAYPPIVVGSRLLKVGESIILADVLEVAIGSSLVTISSCYVANIPNHSSSHKASRARDEQERLIDKDTDIHRQLIAKKLLDDLNLQNISMNKINSPEMREIVRLRLRKIMADMRLNADETIDQSRLEREIFDEVMGLGPLESLLADETITEIMVNSRTQVFVERRGRIELTNVRFSSDQSLIHIIERIAASVGRRIDKSSPIVDARLKDGSRINAVIPPLALNGPCLTIRRFSTAPISCVQLIEWGCAPAEIFALLRAIVVNHKNLVISGGTGSGKTTLLNVLSSFIPDEERIVTIEDAAELRLQQEHVVSLETRPANLEGKGAVTIRDLVRNSLRMRPDRIIVGECRGGEALDMLQAMNTGHDGSMTTAHANTPSDMLRRLETMVLMAGMELPLTAIRQQIASAVTVIVQQTRYKNGRRLISELSWVRGLDSTGDYIVEPMYARSKSSKVIFNSALVEDFCKLEEVEMEAEVKSSLLNYMGGENKC